MIAFQITCVDNVGAAARITGALREVGVNNKKVHFTTVMERYGFLGLFSRQVGKGTIIVKDEDRDNMISQLETLSRQRKNLDLKISKPYYQIDILIPDQIGTLDDKLQKLAREEIDIRFINTEEPDADKMVSATLVLECSLVEYDKAKKLLAECLQGESPFLATAVRDL